MRKKLTKRESLKAVTPVRVYLDDLHALHELLARDGTRVRIDTKEYEVDGIDDVSNIPRERLRDMRFRTDDLSVVVTFTSVGVAVMRFEDTDAAIAIAHKAGELLRSRRRRPVWLYHWTTLVTVLILALVGTNAALAVVDVSDHVALAIRLAGTALAALTCYLSLVRAWWGSVIILRRRAEATSFWTRNRDTLIVGAMVALFSASLGALITYLLKD